MVMPSEENFSCSETEPVFFDCVGGGVRLDRYLVENVDESREKIKESIVEGLTLVNGVRVKPSYKIKKGDSISFIPVPPPLTTAIPENIPLKIVYSDESLVVVDKEAGMVVHPAPGHETGTLVNALLGMKFFRVEEGDLRPGIVHRIDMDTSGLLVVSRTDTARDYFVSLFKEHNIVREYTALVFGIMDSLEGTFSSLHGRNPGNRFMFSSLVKSGKKAVTHYRVIETYGDQASLLKVTLETGRTHQIRVHFYDNSHPLLGDKLYRRNNNFLIARSASERLGRQALHASKLGFIHPVTGEEIIFESDLPQDMAETIEFLRREIYQ
ncbi:MAG: RluA family pseudouridine synthase [Deltaproteobacteria bacterium]|nr:RluA family pseudouridine synthase [Deltaproteobacteria bacterium]